VKNLLSFGYPKATSTWKDFSACRDSERCRQRKCACPNPESSSSWIYFGREFSVTLRWSRSNSGHGDECKTEKDQHWSISLVPRRSGKTSILLYLNRKSLRAAFREIKSL